MLDSKFVRGFILSLGLVSAVCITSGCGGSDENSVVSGQLTPEQQADTEAPPMPSAPGEAGGAAPATPEK
ncbi:MAG: hypothetical protein L7W43_14945 [Rubripirellula sp.]|nr:hypothetical protein [Rubripirellula sp.]